ncbi:TRAPP complex subunit trs33 [Neolentinus lepideus HHB14362 ss-1]|uniref:TRAPP complex subunit trs33 n=1 Tax=Neolentinus lepideus HHB14362 ss-1 TaxID=1314782 RepID=A0A165S456_9AGAM|nr:TRAPP complex subunit trs33 [Neolentinus lepideus HHB14362 ss-1]
MTARNSFQGAPASMIPSSSSSSSTAASGLALADAAPRQMDGPVMDYFLIEVVNVLADSSKFATSRVKKIEQEMIEAGLMSASPPVPAKKEKEKEKEYNVRDSTTSLTSQKGTVKAEPLTDEEEAQRLRLEAIGLHVGANICERLCRDRPLFTDTLDMIKFICKDLWVACWDKQVDNLRTNHRGVYVLQDNSFKPISRLSSWEGRADATKRARMYVAMPAGIIKGALSRLGIQGVVVPEISSLPQCTFQIKLPKGS